MPLKTFRYERKKRSEGETCARARLYNGSHIAHRFGPDDTRSRATSSSPAGSQNTCCCVSRTPTCRGQAPANCGCVRVGCMTRSLIPAVSHTIVVHPLTERRRQPRCDPHQPPPTFPIPPLPSLVRAPHPLLLLRRPVPSLVARQPAPPRSPPPFPLAGPRRSAPDTELATEDLVLFGRSTSIDRVRFLWHGSGNVLFGALTRVDRIFGSC